MMPTDVSPFIEVATQGGLPAETIFEAMAAATELGCGQPYDLGRIGLGNMTGVRMVATPLFSEEDMPTMISIEGWSAYPFLFNTDQLLHWSYVGGKLVPGHNACDAVALTLVLGIALRRPVAVAGACDCPVHRGIVQ